MMMTACCVLFLSVLLLPTMIQATAFGHVPLLFPGLQCFLRLILTLGSTSEMSFDNFDRYFHNDSELILAQTGRYFGSDGIEEYIKFAAAKQFPSWTTI
jgi:hypothetical protein